MNQPAGTGEKEQAQERIGILPAIYEFLEMAGTVTVVVMLLFAFFVRLNVVDGTSMLNTLHDGEWLIVSAFAYEPKAGDIVILHRIDAAPYDNPIVKRVIAVGGQTVDIDFDTWTLTVDGQVVEETYRWLDPTRRTLGCEYELPITLAEDELFVMGDNRNGSADSRQEEIGPIDRRCIVGKALARIAPIKKFTVFVNPFEK